MYAYKIALASLLFSFTLPIVTCQDSRLNYSCTPERNVHTITAQRDCRDIEPVQRVNLFQTYEIINKDSQLLTKILKTRNMTQAHYFLQNDLLIINPLWSNYSIKSPGRRKETILGLACSMGNVYIVNQVVKRSNKDCFLM